MRLCSEITCKPYKNLPLLSTLKTLYIHSEKYGKPNSLLKDILHMQEDFFLTVKLRD